ncbi:carbohydrate porin [Rhizobium herbae]|uniref:Porin n=1 Tax=Rhizobium herbae TaxID=508661 RepID=A0ABS4EU67_9HYPH|nr:carbohydrate porin [Rhizobium herbae]MBP1861472.1 porin [Rhizobium herbae]
MRVLHTTIVPLLLAFTVPASAENPTLILEDTPPGLPAPVYSGPLADIGKSLHDNGIDLRLSYINIYQNAPDFGFAGGSSVNYGVFLFDVTGHLSSDLRVRFMETVNHPSYNEDGYLFDMSNAFFPVPVVDSGTDLTRLTLEADLFDDRFQVEAGRMGLALDFMTKGFCGGLACINSTQAINLNIPGEPLSVWGGRVAYKPTPITTFGLGIIEDNPDNWQNGNGWDWQSGSSDGYIAIANIRHDETFLDNANPLKFEVGAYHRSAPYEDALYNDGWGNPTFGAAPTIITHDSGTSGVYAQARKVIWSTPSGGLIPENVAVYGGIFHTFGEGQAYPWEAYAGLEYSGFWAENPVATIGASVHYIGLSDERAQYERNARLFFSGVDEAQPKDTFMFDVHGSMGMFGNGILDLGAAYVVNPNTSVLADFSTGRQKDGFVFYATLAFDLSGSLGLSPRRGP